MGTLSTFSPFFAFVAVTWAIGPDAGLVAGLMVAFVSLAHQWNRDERREPGVYELCVLVLFALMALYDGFGEPLWTATGVLVRVEMGMLLCVLVSVAMRRPCTGHAARSLPGGEGYGEESFVRVNNVLCAAWALAFTAMVAGELLRQAWPDTDPLTSPLVMVFAASTAECFCRWYIDRGRGRDPREVG